MATRRNIPGPDTQTTATEHVREVLDLLGQGSRCGPERLSALIRSILEGKALPGVAEELACRDRTHEKTGQNGSKTS